MQLGLKAALVIMMLGISGLAFAKDEMQQCLLEAFAKADKDSTVGELEQSCRQQLEEVKKLTAPAKPAQPKPQDDTLVVDTGKENTADEPESNLVKSRLRQEYRARNNRFAILPHKPNYLLPVTFNNNPNEEGLEFAGDEREVDNVEVKFQVSFKTPFWEAPFGENSALFFAYTGQSYWQAYNSEVSSPFRETNHQPEIYAAWNTDWKLGEWQIPAFLVGIEHQSNGRSGLGSRSWNRIYTEWILERNRWVVAFRPWWRIPEDAKEDPLDPEGDDNPDIDDYMGYFELQTRYKWNEQNFGILLRNNLRSDNRGAVQFDWTFPLGESGKLRGYIQYFNGYGESLIDYNRRTNRLGVGFVLTDWL